MGGVGRAIGGIVTSTVKTVSHVVSTAISHVGSALSSLASTAIGVVGSLAGKAAAFVGIVSRLVVGGPANPIIQYLIAKVVAKVVEFLGKKLGIIKEKDKVEDIGCRMEEAGQHEDWKQRDEFQSFEEYYEYLKIQVPDDMVHAKIKTEEDRAKYSILGTMTVTAECEKDMGIALPVEFLVEIGKSRMEADEVRAFAEAFKTLGYDSVCVRQYFDGEMSPEKAQEMTDELVTVLQKHYPHKNQDASNGRINEINIIGIGAEAGQKMIQEKYKEEVKYVEETGTIPEPKA